MRLLVVFHIYYEAQVDYYLSRMGNISGCEWDLLCSGHCLPDEVKEKILAFKPDARFVEVPNIGYDVWPFIQAVKDTDLSLYDIVLKLHTKNTDPYTKTRLNGRYYNGIQWRNLMTEPLIGSREAFCRVLREFEDENVGILYALSVNIQSKCTTVEDSTMLADELERLDIKPMDMFFCAGTMFAVRASALEYLKDPRINIGIFEPTGKSHGGGTNAHVYERILTMAVTARGYKKVLVSSGFFNWFRLSVKMNVQPAMEWLFSINHYGDNNDKYLTLCGHRFLIEKID